MVSVVQLLCCFAAVQASATQMANQQTLEVDIVIVGAGFAGLSAARHIRKHSNLSVHVVEADDHVGGRVRNYDPVTALHDTCTDTVVEIGGTFVSPSHTALIGLATETGQEVYNVSGAGRYPSVHGMSPNVSEPAGEWPWWYWGVDTKGRLLTSVFHTFTGTHRFTAPQDIKAAMDNLTWVQLEAAGQIMQAEAATIECSHNSNSQQQMDKGSWFAADSMTFETWIQQTVSREEARVVLRAMCRGMIAQEPMGVSFLSIVKSMKGCWSLGDDDQYRIRGGSQCPLLRVQEALEQDEAITLSSAVTLVQTIDSDVLVHSEAIELKASTVLLTGSPTVLSAIRHSPRLGHEQVQLLQRMPLGTSMKFFAFYDRAWWHDDGMAGAVMATQMPTNESSVLFSACQDHSPYLQTIEQQGVAALMCWIEGETNQQLYDRYSAGQRKQLLLDFLQYSLNDTRATSLNIGVLEYNWADKEWIGGAYTGYFSPGVQSQPEMWRAYATARKSEHVWVAGADYQVGLGNGYMEGAIRNGIAAADEMIAYIHSKQ